MINQIKTVLFLGVLSGLLLALGGFFGGTSGLTMGLIIALVMNVGSLLFSHKVVLMMYRAKEAQKNQYPKLHAMVEEIAEKAKIPKPKIYIVPSHNPNAFATGPSYKKSVVACTQGIMNLLSEEELKGVLAHEVAHIKNRDMLISTIAATIASVISYVAFMARFAAIFGGGVRDEEGGSNLIELLALSIIAPLAATIIQLAISRSREFIADEGGARLINNPEPLAKALLKLESGSKHNPMQLGSDATNNLFIVNPFRGTGRAFVNLFRTHPPTHQRVQKLRALKI